MPDLPAVGERATVAAGRHRGRSGVVARRMDGECEFARDDDGRLRRPRGLSEALVGVVLDGERSPSYFWPEQLTW